jgi:hypothetical protein
MSASRVGFCSEPPRETSRNVRRSEAEIEEDLSVERAVLVAEEKEFDPRRVSEEEHGTESVRRNVEDERRRDGIEYFGS